MPIGDSSAQVPEVDEEAVRALKLSKDINTLARDADFDENRRDFSVKTRICYNSACPDYRRERTDSEDCACKRTAVRGAGDSRFG